MRQPFGHGPLTLTGLPAGSTSYTLPSTMIVAGYAEAGSGKSSLWSGSEDAMSEGTA